MPTISMFYGIIIRMLYIDNQRHNLPHLHVEYQGIKSVISIPDGELIEGELPGKNSDWYKLGLLSMKRN